MEKYENLGTVGEGSYGTVLKCRHKETNQMFAIKKFIESEEDKMVSKIAKREVKMLQLLRHVNLVSLLEVFRKKKRLYLVFEFVDRTVLDDLEKHPSGLNEQHVCGLLWQVLHGLQFIHDYNVIHRDIKPENVLISSGGVVKLCDFGFARLLGAPNEKYTDYVATRWYRAPELLVGDVQYSKGVDIWATGCLVSEMLTGEPLFPGDSDIDQIFHISKCLGNLITRHREIFSRNPLFQGVRLPAVRRITALERRYSKLSEASLSMIKSCLKLDPRDRPECSRLFEEELFLKNGEFLFRYKKKLNNSMEQEYKSNILLQRLSIKPSGFPISLDTDDIMNSLQHENSEKKKEKRRKKIQKITVNKKDSAIENLEKSANKCELYNKNYDTINNSTNIEDVPTSNNNLNPVTHLKKLSSQDRKSAKIILGTNKINKPPSPLNSPTAVSRPLRRNYKPEEEEISTLFNNYDNNITLTTVPNRAFDNSPNAPLLSKKQDLTLYRSYHTAYQSPPTLFHPGHRNRNSPQQTCQHQQLHIGLEVSLQANTQPNAQNIHTIDRNMFNYSPTGRSHGYHNFHAHAPSIAGRSEASTIYMDKIKLDLAERTNRYSESPFRPSNLDSTNTIAAENNKSNLYLSKLAQQNVILPSLHKLGSLKASINKGPMKATHVYDNSALPQKHMEANNNNNNNAMFMFSKGPMLDPFQQFAGVRLSQKSPDELSDTRSTQAESSSLPYV